ncbi:UNVERIFIED_CONTAM: hypothetical protein NCL1_49711 [Trichonephila clavipes]
MKFLVPLFVLITAVEFGDAIKIASRGPSNAGYCDVNCVGDNCKIVRNGNASSCACTSGDDDATTSGSCSITCPGGCKAIANNGQCYCLCNGNDGDDVCVIDCPPQCTVTRDRFDRD